MQTGIFSSPAEGLAELVMSIGKADFLQYFDRTLTAVVPVDHITLFISDPMLIPHFVAGVSRNESHITSRLSQLYEKYFYYCDDPNLKSIGRGHDNNAPLLQQLYAKNIKNPSYRKNIYEDNNLIERLSLIDHDKEKYFILNLYREEKSGYFNQEEIDRLQRGAVLIGAFIKRHLSLLPLPNGMAGEIPPIVKLENLVIGLDQRLSRREIEVCARVMGGLTREAVSLDLGIKPSTVATLMRRAYQKLNISSLNELFALCLARQSQMSTVIQRDDIL